MNVTITGNGFEVSERLRQYVDKRLVRLERHLEDTGDVVDLHVVLTLQRTRSADHHSRAEVTIWVGNAALRGEEDAPDFPAAFDAVMEKLDRQIERHKNRIAAVRAREERSLQQQALQATVAQEESAQDIIPAIVRTKRFAMKPMSAMEAAEQMEMLGHSFFVFLDQENSSINVVYKRRDGNYGLIAPELA